MATTTITGSDTPQANVDAFELALSDSRVDRILLKGTFNFGLGTQRKTVTINRGVTIEGAPARPGRGPDTGAPEESEPNTTGVLPLIIGGGLNQPTGTCYGTFSTGAFRVQTTDTTRPVVIKHIRFEQFLANGIFVDACRDLEVSDCHFSEPVPGSTDVLPAPPPQYGPGPITLISGIQAAGKNCRGHLSVLSNTCRFDSTQNPPDDEQFLACVQTSFSSIQVIKNQITTRDDGVEIIFNGALEDPTKPFPCAILLQNNTITINQLVDYNRWPGHSAILCCHNGLDLNATESNTRILDNEITAKGQGVGFTLTGEHFVLRDNILNQNPGPSSTVADAAIMLGCDATLPGFSENLGPSVNHSHIFHNRFSGKASFAFLTYQADSNEPNPDSHGNVVESNDFSAFTAVQAFSYVPGAHDNVAIHGPGI